MMEGMEEMEVKIEQENLHYPGELEVGQTLPDAHMNMDVSMNGMTVMSMKINITDRKVEAIENMETSAGTFPCVKISYTTTSKMMMGEFTSKTIEWISLNVGVVRSETYNEKDQLEGYRILTEITQN
jgi:hypothetical protein